MTNDTNDTTLSVFLHYQKVRVKVCNHPFTLNFLYYICVHLYLFPTAPAVKTIELFANRNISKERESNNNYKTEIYDFRDYRNSFPNERRNQR